MTMYDQQPLPYRDTDSTPSVAAITAFWANRTLPGTDYVLDVDADEPECFACGWSPLDTISSEDNRIALKRRMGLLERAHAVPRSRWGSARPENLAILCKSCHADAPDVIDARLFWRWIADHPKTGRFDFLFAAGALPKDICRDYTGPGWRPARGFLGLSDREFAALARLDPAEIPGRLREAASDLQPAPHVGNLSPGTVTALLRHMVQPRRRKP